MHHVRVPGENHYPGNVAAGRAALCRRRLASTAMAPISPASDTTSEGGLVNPVQGAVPRPAGERDHLEQAQGAREYRARGDAPAAQQPGGQQEEHAERDRKDSIGSAAIKVLQPDHDRAAEFTQGEYPGDSGQRGHFVSVHRCLRMRNLW